MVHIALHIIYLHFLGFYRSGPVASYKFWEASQNSMISGRLVGCEESGVLLEGLRIAFQNRNNLVKMWSFIWIAGPASVDEMTKGQWTFWG